MNNFDFKVGDLVAIKPRHLMLNEEYPAVGTIVADGANLKYYTPEECEKFGYEYINSLTVNFNRRRLLEDQDLYVRTGDFIQYGELFYEIVRTYNDTRFYFGQVEHKFQVSAECVRARRGIFKVKKSVTRPS